ncbi:acyltransferase family protein [Zhihengliuella halotolerans]|uniref:Fucose 4-O-acetylase-like acetyltransferase n=1 Tax=Zhihengliuella halotolerans TaxID=370736 RepID=A0A4V6MGG2_9MICC|nr:acyltransferase [Zhihengliuella halotolerans]RZU62646.1 fucose 4-O-acetylase-like acetyltransferase [Zhihengliuella halotolerans]
MHGTETAPRLHWMDFLRGIAVLLVVVMHTNEHSGVPLEGWAEANEYLAPFRMPLLMFLSGVLLDRSLAKPIPTYAWGKIAAIGWPLLVWLVLYGVFVDQGFGLPADLSAYILNGNYLWFLIALLACYAAAIVFKPLIPALPVIHHWLYLAVFAGLVAVCAVSGIEPGLVGNTLWFGAFFFLGAWARHYIPRWINAPALLSVPVLVLVAFASIAAVPRGDLIFGSPVGAGLSLLGIAVIVWFAPRLPGSAFYSFVTWCGRSSIVVYVAHFPILVLLRDTVLSAVTLPQAAHVLVLTAATLGITLFFVWARPWTPWLYALPRRHRPAGPDRRAV